MVILNKRTRSCLEMFFSFLFSIWWFKVWSSYVTWLKAERSVERPYLLVNLGMQRRKEKCQVVLQPRLFRKSSKTALPESWSCPLPATLALLPYIWLPNQPSSFLPPRLCLCYSFFLEHPTLLASVFHLPNEITLILQGLVQVPLTTSLTPLKM